MEKSCKEEGAELWPLRLYGALTPLVITPFEPANKIVDKEEEEKVKTNSLDL